jgi:hypothetical protein
MVGSFPVVVEFSLLVIVVGLIINAFDPEFRGGWFARTTLLIALVLVVAILMRDVMAAVTGQQSKPDSPTVVMQLEEGSVSPADWGTVGLAFVTIAALFASLLLLGIVLGTTVAAWVVLVWKMRVSVHRAVFGAAILGIVIPVPFAYVLGLNLWPGLIPQIVPDWVGGGLMPPL